MTSSRRHNRRPLLLAMLAFAAAVPLATPASAVTVVTSGGLALSVNLQLAALAAVGVGPLAVASGTAAPAYSTNSSVLSVDSLLDLSSTPLTAGMSVKTGLLTAAASSPFPVTPTGRGASQVNNLALGLTSKLLFVPTKSLFTLGATTIDSLSTVSGIGTPTATGSSSIEGLTLSLLGVALDASLYAHAAPNTVVPIAGLTGLRITFNEQTPSGDGVSSAGIVTNAIDINFDRFLLGTNLLNGSIIIGQSRAAITGVTGPTATVPEPAIWMELIGGFALVGLARRRAANRTADRGAA